MIESRILIIDLKIILKIGTLEKVHIISFTMTIIATKVTEAGIGKEIEDSVVVEITVDRTEDLEVIIEEIEETEAIGE
jgi:hypothetical protein